MRRPLLAALVLLAACGDQKVGVYNTPPVVSITSPPDGTSVDEGVVIDFQGLVSDSPTAAPDLVLQWSSDVAGVLTDDEVADSSGVVLYSTGSLEVGNHAVTLAATDEAGERTEYTVAITIVDVPDNPTLSVVHPASGESGVEAEPFEFVVQVADEQQEGPALAITFESDLDGVFCQPTADAIGVASCEQVLSPGDHRLTFTATDLDGYSAVEEVYFTVVSASAIDDDGDAWTEDQGDCNDGDSSVHPNAEEFYNGRDDDCDGVTDDGTVGYDDDLDGQSELAGDCDDADAAKYSGGTEIYDAKDNDCDGTTDEDTEGYDDDGDGVAEIAGDCNDADATSEPGAPELEDGRDNDCDGTIDEGTNAYDDDGDGYTENGGDCNDASYSVNPGVAETCDGVDNDCDGSYDEQNASGCTTYYYDYDADGYGSSSVAGRCYCSSSSYYTSLNNSDCYDYNASANPIHTTYHTTVRGDSSYDYNCDGVETKAYSGSKSCTTTLGDCEPTGTGFYGSTPSCGSSGTYLDDDDDCDWNWDWFSSSCEVDGAASATQACL